MAEAKQVRITASIEVADSYWDRLDLFYSANANSPSWVFIGSLYGSHTGLQTVSTTYTLPAGSLQAIRGRFSYHSSTTDPCTPVSGSKTDHDDLVFAVGAAPADITPPEVTLTAPAEGAIVPQAITLTAAATDNVGVSRVEFYGDGALVASDTSAPYSAVWNTSAGAHTVSAKAYDAKDNVGSFAPVSVESNPAPSVWFVEPEPNAFSDGSFHVLAEATDDTGITQVQFVVGGTVYATVTVPPYEADLSVAGVVTVTARAFDTSGNASDATITVRNDTSAPQVAILHPTHMSTVSGTVDITANAIDDIEVARVEFYADDVLLGTDPDAPYGVSWDTLPLQNGPEARSVSLRARVYDLAGRFADSTISVDVLNDTTPPTVTWVSPVEGAVVSGGVSFSANASDDLSVASVSYAIDGVELGSASATPYELFWDSTSVANGPHTLTATARDGHQNAGNQSIQIWVDNDLTPPEVAISSPASGAVVEGTVTVTATASDDRAVTKVEFLINGSVFATDTSEPWSVLWNTRSTTWNGTRNLTARAHDAAGHVTTSAVTEVTLDNDWTPPTVAFTSPAANAIVSGTTQVTATASDNRAVQRVEFLVNGVLVLTQSSAPFVFAWDTFTVSDGANQLRARAYDSAGNMSQSAITVTVQNDPPPQVTLSTPIDGTVVNGTIPLSATATDNKGVTRVEFLVDEALVGTASSSPYSVSWDSASVGNGLHAVTARAFDTGSQEGRSQTVMIDVSNAESGVAAYDATLQVPACSTAGPVCDSGALLEGRGPLGPEPNAPNTLGGTCVDGSYGALYSDESNEKLRVETQDGAPLATGKVVVISADVYAWGQADYLDLYHSADVDNPVWTYLTTLQSPGSGPQTLTATFTLPAGSRQAIRAIFRYGGTSSTCSSGGFDDNDDLVFAVDP